MTRRETVVPNPLGLHARAAARFVNVAAKFESRILVRRNGRSVDGKSIMGVLLLAAGRGVSIEISAEGSDEVEAVDALAALVLSGFGELS